MATGCHQGTEEHMKKIIEYVFGAAALLLLTMTSVGYGFQLVSTPSDFAVVAGVALLAMTLSAWTWLVIHFWPKGGTTRA